MSRMDVRFGGFHADVGRMDEDGFGRAHVPAVEGGRAADDSSVRRMGTPPPSPLEGYEGLSVRTQARVVASQVRDRLISRVGLWMLLVCA